MKHTYRFPVVSAVVQAIGVAALYSLIGTLFHRLGGISSPIGRFAYVAGIYELLIPALLSVLLISQKAWRATAEAWFTPVVWLLSAILAFGWLTRHLLEAHVVIAAGIAALIGYGATSLLFLLRSDGHRLIVVTRKGRAIELGVVSYSVGLDILASMMVIHSDANEWSELLSRNGEVEFSAVIERGRGDNEKNVMLRAYGCPGCVERVQGRFARSMERLGR